MTVEALDHLVLTVKSFDETCDFYEQNLGMKREVFAQGRIALTFGRQKINLHKAGYEFEPKALRPTPGSADLCFVVKSVSKMQKHLKKNGVPIIEGPVQRTGAVGTLLSIYIRDPDQNLIELSEYV